jgi:hypothetical protein
VGAVQEAEAVDLEHPAPLVGVGAHDGAEQHQPRVVDEAVEPAELRVRLLDERARLVLLADVGRQRDRAAAVLLDALGERLEPIGAAAGQRDARTGLGGEQRGRLADARRRSGDGDGTS